MRLKAKTGFKRKPFPAARAKATTCSRDSLALASGMKPTVSKTENISRKSEKKSSGIRQVTRKRANENSKYTAVRRKFLEANPDCGLCGNPATEIHHTRGRIGRLLCASEFFVPLCSECHRDCHTAPSEFREKKWNGIPLFCKPADWNTYPIAE